MFIAFDGGTPQDFYGLFDDDYLGLNWSMRKVVNWKEGKCSFVGIFQPNFAPQLQET